VRVNRNNWFIRWTYMFGAIPRQTSLCRVFWRGCVAMPLAMVGMGLVLAFLITSVLMYPLGTAKFFGVVVGALVGIAAFIGGGVWIDELREANGSVLPSSVRESVPYRAILSVKSKVCPIITIERTA
jgi:hypothetical protein